jgi:two-component system, cell cycle response regulator DivK
VLRRVSRGTPLSSTEFPFRKFLSASGYVYAWTARLRMVRRPRAEQVQIMQKSVLIVEDNELNMKLFNDLLEAHGYKTVQTRSGVEAVELARIHRPHLILMDIQLPEVSGLQVTQWIKDDEDLRHIPVIAITAFAMKGDEEKIRQGGCEAYLSKPISVVKFLETVRNYIAEQ